MNARIYALATAVHNSSVACLARGTMARPIGGLSRCFRTIPRGEGERTRKRFTIGMISGASTDAPRGVHRSPRAPDRSTVNVRN